MKLYLYIRDPEDYFAGDYDFCFHIAGRNDLTLAKKWVFVTALEIDFSHISLEQVISTAVAGLDEEIQRQRSYYDQKLTELEVRKQNLLALEAPHA